VVVFCGIFLWEARIGLIECNEDSGVVHEGGIVDFVVQKGRQPTRRSFQVDDDSAFVTVGNVPGDMGKPVLTIVLFEFTSVNNVLAPERIPANVVHGHERIGEAEIFAFGESLLVELSIVAWAREILSVDLPSEPNRFQLIDKIGDVQVMDIVITDIEGRSSDGANVVWLGGMTEGSVV